MEQLVKCEEQIFWWKKQDQIATLFHVYKKQGLIFAMLEQYIKL
jgi:hypothetical protein